MAHSTQSTIFENKAFQKPTAGIGFNLVHQTSNFNSVFHTKPLDPKESSELERLLFDNYQAGTLTKEKVRTDIEQLKLLTVEIKAIGKQGTVLMGERAKRAKELLKPYKDGTFTKWLESTFGTRKTGYNMLAYYELYSALPHDDLRERLKKIPQRTAYILASRQGDLAIKAEIIDTHHDRKHHELMLFIQEKLPVSIIDRRVAKHAKQANNKLIATIRESLQKLKKHKHSLTESDKKDLNLLSAMLMALVDGSY